MKKKSLPIAVGVVVLAAVVAFFVWPGDNTNDQVKSITIGTFTKSLGNSPFHVAYHFGWFKEHPDLKDVEINYINYNDRPSISDAFSSGELDALFSADIPQILCYAQGNDIRVVAVSARMDQDIIVRNEVDAESFEDLRGKRLAVLQGTSSYFGLLKLLEEENMTLDDFDVRYLAVAEARTAFETDRIDAWAVWAPYVEQQQLTGKGKLVAAGRAPIISCMAVATPLVEDHPKIVEALVEVIDRAKKWIAENPEETQQIIADDFGLAPEVIEIALPKFNWHAQFSDELIEDMQWKADFLRESGQTRTDEPIDVRDDLLELRFAPAGPSAAEEDEASHKKAA